MNSCTRGLEISASSLMYCDSTGGDLSPSSPLTSSACWYSSIWLQTEKETAPTPHGSSHAAYTLNELCEKHPQQKPCSLTANIGSAATQVHLRCCAPESVRVLSGALQAWPTLKESKSQTAQQDRALGWHGRAGSWGCGIPCHTRASSGWHHSTHHLKGPFQSEALWLQRGSLAFGRCRLIARFWMAVRSWS